MNLLSIMLSIAGVVEPQAMPLTVFYDAPPSFAGTGRPGDLIRTQQFEGYHVPKGVQATRILFGSKNSQGKLVSCSGVVLIPPGRPPNSGWPIIAFAHGSSGVSRKCAPSLMATCFSDYETPCIYAERGYAVVAPDYAGLGTAYSLDYMDRISNGWDVINGVKAAQKALPELGPKWIAVGHSAGAHAMRGVAEIQYRINDPSYLGVIAASGLGDVRCPMTVLSKEVAYLAVYLCEAVRARYPGFNHSDVFTERGMELLEKLRTTCTGPGTPKPKAPPLKGSEVLKKNWEQNIYIEKYFKLDETNREIYKGPILVINGEKEPPLVLANDIKTAKRMSRQQDLDIRFKLIPGANHFSLLVASMAEQLEWIENRFAGKKVRANRGDFISLQASP